MRPSTREAEDGRNSGRLRDEWLKSGELGFMRPKP